MALEAPRHLPRCPFQLVTIRRTHCSSSVGIHWARTTAPPSDCRETMSSVRSILWTTSAYKGCDIALSLGLIGDIFHQLFITPNITWSRNLQTSPHQRLARLNLLLSAQARAGISHSTIWDCSGRIHGTQRIG